MTQTQTIAPNGTTVTTWDHPTWKVTQYRTPGALTSKLICVAPSGQRAIHVAKVTDQALEITIAKVTGTVIDTVAPSTHAANLDATIANMIDAQKDVA